MLRFTSFFGQNSKFTALFNIEQLKKVIEIDALERAQVRISKNSPLLLIEKDYTPDLTSETFFYFGKSYSINLSTSYCR